MHNHSDAAAYVPSFITTSSSAAATTASSTSSGKPITCAQRISSNHATTPLASAHFSEFKHLPSEEHEEWCKQSEENYNEKCTILTLTDSAEPPRSSLSTTAVFSSNTANSIATDNADVTTRYNSETIKQNNYSTKTNKETLPKNCQEKRFLISEEQYKFIFATLSWNVELQRILLRNATSPLKATFANKPENSFHDKEKKLCTNSQSEQTTESIYNSRKETSSKQPSPSPRPVHTWAEMLTIQTKYNNTNNNFNNINENNCKEHSELLESSRAELDLLDLNAFPSLEEIDKLKKRRKSKRSYSEELKESNERKLPLRVVYTQNYDKTVDELHNNMISQARSNQTKCSDTTYTWYSNTLNSNDNNNDYCNKGTEKKEQYCKEEPCEFTSVNTHAIVSTESSESKRNENNSINEKQQREDSFQWRKGQKTCRRANQRKHVRQMLLERYNNKEIRTPNLTIKLIVPSVIDDTSRSEQLYAAPDEVCEAFFSNLHNNNNSNNNHNNQSIDVCKANSITNTGTNANTRKQVRHHGKLTNIDKWSKNKCRLNSALSEEKKEMTPFMPDLYFQPWRLPTNKEKKNIMQNFNSLCELTENELQKHEKQEQHKTQFTMYMESDDNNISSNYEPNIVNEEQEEFIESDKLHSMAENSSTNTADRRIGHDVESVLEPSFKPMYSFTNHNDIKDVESNAKENVYADDNVEDDDSDEIPLFQLSRRATRALRPVQAPFNKPSHKQHQLYYDDKSVLKYSCSAQHSTNNAYSLSRAKAQQERQSKHENLEELPLDLKTSSSHHVINVNEHVKTDAALPNTNDVGANENDEHKETDDHVAEETKPCTPVNNTIEHIEPLYKPLYSSASSSPESMEHYHSFDFFHQMFLRSFIVIALAQVKLSERLARVANCTTLNHNKITMSTKINCSNNVLEPEERRALSFFYRYYDAYKERMMKLVMRSEDEFMRRSFQQILESCEKNDLTCKNREEEEEKEFEYKTNNNKNEYAHHNDARCQCIHNNKDNICQSCRQAQPQNNTEFYTEEQLMKEMNSCKDLLTINQLFISGKYAAWQPFLMDVFDITRVVQCYAERDTLLAAASVLSTHLYTGHVPHAQNFTWSNNSSSHIAQMNCCNNGNITTSDNINALSYKPPFSQNATHQQLLADSLHKFIMTHLNDIFANSPIYKTNSATSPARNGTSLEEEESEMLLQYIKCWTKESDRNTEVCNEHKNNYNNFSIVHYNTSSMCSTPYCTHNSHNFPSTAHSAQLHYQTHMSNIAFMNCRTNNNSNIVEQLFTPLQWCEETMADSTLHQCGVKLYKSVLPVSRRVVYKMVIPAEDTEKYNLARFFQPSIFNFIAGGAVACHESQYSSNNKCHAIHVNNSCINSVGIQHHENYNNSYNNNSNYIHLISNSLNQEAQVPIANANKSANNTLVHCSAGMHRSSGLVIAFLLYMMHTNKARQSSAGIADQIVITTTKSSATTTTHQHRHIDAHIGKHNSNNKLQSNETKAKQMVNVCLQHVRKQRQIAEPIPSVIKMLQEYAAQIHSMEQE